MQLPRRVQDELLDGLAATDPVAARSRRDLQRVHRFMRTRAALVHSLRQIVPAPGQPLRVLELGAGDGTLLLGVARDLAPAWPAVELTLLDRQALVADATVADYARYGWTARSSVMDVLDWARAATSAPSAAASRWDVVIANLFLHHFDGPELTRVLGGDRGEHLRVAGLRTAPQPAGARGQSPDRRARRQRRHARRCRAQRARRLSPSRAHGVVAGDGGLAPAGSAGGCIPALLSRDARRGAVMQPARDAVIVGAGPAGSAAAIILARAGWSVTLVEKGRLSAPQGLR